MKIQNENVRGEREWKMPKVSEEKENGKCPKCPKMSEVLKCPKYQQQQAHIPVGHGSFFHSRSAAIPLLYSGVALYNATERETMGDDCHASTSPYTPSDT